MRTGWVILGLSVAGCGGSGGPAVNVARPAQPRTGGIPPFPTAAAPPASDPAAKAAAAKILAAHTNNDPALLEKVKTVRVVRDGVMHPRPGEGAGDLPVAFEFTAAWPDTCKYT